jgi:hypothetical protein
MSRKKAYASIAPLCTVRPVPFEPEMYPGCHHLFDDEYDKFRALWPRFNAKKAAAETERKWKRFLAGESVGLPSSEHEQGVLYGSL